jgi:hypothetical protein
MTLLKNAVNQFCNRYMNHYCDEWIEEWCEKNGWTDLFRERPNSYWAFPPFGVMPQPIPLQDLRIIKSQKGLSKEERLWTISAIVATVVAGLLCYFLKSPMPMFLAIAFDMVTVAQFED